MELVDALVQTLRDWDVRYVFGVSGANIEHLHDAVHRLGGARLTSVMARREDGAAFMADCRARVHRTLGVCCSTSGGGMMNLAVGLAESYADSVPVLAIVGQSPLAQDGRGAFQDSSGIGRTVDAVGLLSAVTKQTLRIAEPADFWTTVHTAVATALTGRPGPVALLLPRDVATASVPPRPAYWPADLAAVTAGRPDGLSGADHLFEAIFEADCPVLLLGQGVRRSTDPEAVVRFAQESHIPVATTMTARAEFPNEDRLYLGVVGMTGHPSAHDFVTHRADLVIAVGTGLSMMTRASLGLEPDRVAVVNIDPAAVYLPAPPRLVVAADAGQVFRHLRARLDADPRHAAGPGDYQLRRFVPRLTAQVPPATPHPHHEADDLLQSTALEILDAALPLRGHIVFDAGNCAAAALHLTSTPAQATATVALGAGGMGYSIPAAIGAQLGSPPGTRTTVVCGDGALLMNGLEIHTAVDLALPILFVVFNNQMHGMCTTRQQQFFDSRIECSRYGPLDVTTLVRGLGSADRLWTASAGTSAELRRHLDSYYQLPRPVPGVLELRLRREQMPPYASLLPPQEPTYAVARSVISTQEGTPH